MGVGKGWMYRDQFVTYSVMYISVSLHCLVPYHFTEKVALIIGRL